MIFAFYNKKIFMSQFRIKNKHKALLKRQINIEHKQQSKILGRFKGISKQSKIRNAYQNQSRWDQIVYARGLLRFKIEQNRLDDNFYEFLSKIMNKKISIVQAFHRKMMRIHGSQAQTIAFILGNWRDQRCGLPSEQTKFSEVHKNKNDFDSQIDVPLTLQLCTDEIDAIDKIILGENSPQESDEEVTVFDFSQENYQEKDEDRTGSFMDLEMSMEKQTNEIQYIQ